MANDVLGESARHNPTLTEVSDARAVADMVPGAFSQETVALTGEKKEHIGNMASPLLEVTTGFGAGHEKLTVDAGIDRDHKKLGPRQYSSTTTYNVYGSDGPKDIDVASGQVQIKQTLPDGTEKISTTSQKPKMAQMIARLASRDVIEKLRQP